MNSKTYKMKTKAQVSLFIIIGIIVIVSAGIIFFTSTQEAKEEILPGVFISTKEIPTELDPVRKFVSECLEDTAVRGLKLIGEHGGYIGMENPELTKETFEINNNPTESDAVVFAPGGNLKIPYWHYLKSENECTGSCVFASKRPPLREGENSIQEQLNRYIEKEFPKCINSFEDLKQQGFEIDIIKKESADVRVAEEDIVVILDYSLEVKKDDVVSSLDQFFVRIPLNLQKIYNLATEITNLQQEFRFLEKQTMNLISGFASIDEDKFPPITDLRFRPGSGTSWKKSNVRERIAQTLMSYIPLFQVENTKNFDRIFYSSSLKQNLYDTMIIPSRQQYNELDVNFNYLDFWPIFFDLNCNGEICNPESASSGLFSDILGFIGLQRYNFVYDVSFPALVEIVDESALNSRGYKFNFFLESNVRNNKEMPAEFFPLQAISTASTSFLCDPGNRNSGNVVVKVLNPDSKPIGDASITFSTAGESCYIGKTDENGILSTKFPTGTAGGVVSFLKQDYISKSWLFDAKKSDSSLDVVLEPVNDKKIVVKKKLLEKSGKSWSFTNKISDLSESEEAHISLTRLSPITEEEFSSFASLSGPNSEEIRIAPGKYEVSINMFLREKLSIPEKKIKKKIGLFNEEEFEMPGFEFNENNPYPSGGLRLNVTITENDLRKGTIVFYAISPVLQNVPEQDRSLEDLEQTGKIDEYSKVFEALLRPSFQ
tara:strand:- start:214 stop:2358 length:2145 start_codon:yes stop_codon:yes gene_type:complete